MMISLVERFQKKIPKNYKKISFYTFLNGLQVFLGLIFQFQFALIFGTSTYADVYFVGITIVTFFVTIGLFFTEMFMQYYNDVKVVNSKNAAMFYQAVFNLSAVVGVTMFILILVTFNGMCKLFAPGFDPNRIALLKSFFSLIGLNIVLTGLITLNLSLLTAEMKFMLPYILGLLPNTFKIISILIYSGSHGLKAIAISTLLAGVVTIAIQHIYILKLLNVHFSSAFWHPELKKLIRGSFSMRMGSQLWNIKDVIITNILSRFSIGTISLYTYAFRVISNLYAISNSPILRIFSAKVTLYVSLKDYGSIKKILKKTLIVNTGILVVILIPFVFMLPNILKSFFGHKFSIEDIKLIHYIFIALIPFYLIISIEILYSTVIIALKQSLKVITINAVFLFVFVVSVLSLVKIIGIYSIPVSLIIAQTFLLIMYVYSTRQYLDEVDLKVNNPCIK